MITTDFVPGSPCWIELSSPDASASAAFYRELFGWEVVPTGPESVGYWMLSLDGTIVAGLGPVMGESERPAWAVYFADPDVDDTVLAVERLGGTLVVEPFDVLGFGRTAQFTDPQSGYLGTWQAATFQGFDAVDRPGTLCWVELWTPDAAGAREFYGELFKWGFTDFALPGEAGTYTILTPAGLGQERAHGGIMQVEPDGLAATGGAADWHPVFAVENCDAAVERVRSAGGQVYMGPESTPGVGRLAVCADVFGSGFVLLAPSPM
ncbi:VOC family protein [Nocardiopsis sp. CT-R113]|uniref:VOC family protein n=1 Tax=Nocardiopsis codii TaxID=3065942 RepID=A0ABU7K9W7_9ACTN|nr:VOC family protein [Nocardiopsis sp. CT-R113]MEE2039033.1 VOC family protein [Nocardiopsis sp. CT-R113]